LKRDLWVGRSGPALHGLLQRLTKLLLRELVGHIVQGTLEGVRDVGVLIANDLKVIREVASAPIGVILARGSRSYLVNGNAVRGVHCELRRLRTSGLLSVLVGQL
jgi:hypothetical protein